MSSEKNYSRNTFWLGIIGIGCFGCSDPSCFGWHTPFITHDVGCAKQRNRVPQIAVGAACVAERRCNEAFALARCKKWKLKRKRPTNSPSTLRLETSI